jgi:hypothetical protein
MVEEQPCPWFLQVAEDPRQYQQGVPSKPDGEALICLGKWSRKALLLLVLEGTVLEEEVPSSSAL